MWNHQGSILWVFNRLLAIAIRLLLSARKGDASFTDQSIVTIWEIHDHVWIAAIQRHLQSLLGDFLVRAIADIFTDRP